MQNLNLQFKTKNNRAKRDKLFAFSRASRENGFTLIEMIAAIGIFTITTTVAMTVFLSMSSSQKRYSAGIDINNAAYFAMETMSKEIRTGRNFDFDGCFWDPNDWENSSCGALSFENYHGENVAYGLSSGRIVKSCEPDCASGPITPSSMQITGLVFNMSGVEKPDEKQSRITMVLTAETPAGVSAPVKQSLHLQTTISARNPDS